IKAFISAILGHDPTGKNIDGGILGIVKAYYGCVEAQGRGSLHCHLLVWVEGGLNPNDLKDRVLKDEEFKSRLIDFLEDTISTCVPDDVPDAPSVQSSTFHPCSVRGAPVDLVGDQLQAASQKDFHNLVNSCQVHAHTKTCYKYCRDGEAKFCRFDLDESNVQPDTIVNPETGEIELKCSNGLVNSYNETIIKAVRCNMDIKFIGSGASAKAILYYITDYITKTQLKAHVAYAALEVAIGKVGCADDTTNDAALRAKKVLQKCAFSMISQQELSAQQVCSYLMDLEDHFTSHSFRRLYWSNVERYINDIEPSPECYVTSPIDESVEDAIDVDIDEQEDTDLPDVDIEDVTCPATEDEVRVTVDPSGVLVADTDVLNDYLFRHKDLVNICL
ncbi:hypothetical protein K435DRAFT_591017, partial [Dendrothele bispora CBS 962.96]